MREVSNKANNAELKLFLEVELGQVMPSFLFAESYHLCIVGSTVDGMDLFLFVLCHDQPIIIQDLKPVPPPEKTKEDILLFFKLYEPLKEMLQ